MDNLDAVLVALSDSTRRSILERLAEGPATVNAIAARFDLTQQAISKHLAYLERTQLIEKRREGRQQICSLRGEPLQDVISWAENCRRIWSSRFDRLEQVLEAMKKEKRRGKK